MNTPRYYHRVMIDLDPAGNPIGLAVELHQDDERVGLTVLERPGPFDTPAEQLQRALVWLEEFRGFQLTLQWEL
jgi:hypothetical protein